MTCCCNISIEGCTGTTRPIGAGKMTRKPYGQFGPRDGEPSIRTLQLSAKESLSASGSHFTYNDSLKPKIPSKDDKPVMGIRSSKNFITANAVEAILQGNIFLHFLHESF
jgi:hypothetical protein